MLPRQTNGDVPYNMAMVYNMAMLYLQLNVELLGWMTADRDGLDAIGMKRMLDMKLVMRASSPAVRCRSARLGDRG